RGADHAGCDQDEQLALLDRVDLRAEGGAENRYVLEERDAAVGRRPLVADSATQDERLVVAEHHGRLHFALDDAPRARVPLARPDDNETLVLRSEEHTTELQSLTNLVCSRLLACE